MAAASALTTKGMLQAATKQGGPKTLRPHFKRFIVKHMLYFTGAPKRAMNSQHDEQKRHKALFQNDQFKKHYSSLFIHNKSDTQHRMDDKQFITVSVAASTTMRPAHQAQR